MTTEEIANIVLWGLQLLLGFGFLFAGFAHAFRFDQFSAQPRMGWALAVGRQNMRIIGLSEMAGGIGLMLPAATGILPWLSVLAAFCLALLMGSAFVFHVRRHEPAIVTLAMGAMALVIVAGRLFVAPF